MLLQMIHFSSHVPRFLGTVNRAQTSDEELLIEDQDSDAVCKRGRESAARELLAYQAVAIFRPKLGVWLS